MKTTMLDLQTLTGIAREAARGVLTDKLLVDVRAEEITDSRGEEALEFLVVLKSLSPKQLRKVPYVAIDRAITHGVMDTGEERFPFVRYRTTDDLADDADPES